MKVPRPNVLLAVSLSLPGAQKAFTSSRASGGCGPSPVVSLGSLFYALGVVRALSVHLWILTSAGQDGRNAPKQLCRFAMFCSPAPCVAGNSAARRRHSRLRVMHGRKATRVIEAKSLRSRNILRLRGGAGVGYARLSIFRNPGGPAEFQALGSHGMGVSPAATWNLRILPFQKSSFRGTGDGQGLPLALRALEDKYTPNHNTFWSPNKPPCEDIFSPCLPDPRFRRRCRGDGRAPPRHAAQEHRTKARDDSRKAKERLVGTPPPCLPTSPSLPRRIQLTYRGTNELRGASTRDNHAAEPLFYGGQDAFFFRSPAGNATPLAGISDLRGGGGTDTGCMQ